MTGLKINATELDQRLAAVNDYVRDCERRVERGEIMDLQGLDQNVIEICDAIAGLPGAEARTLEPKMAALIDNLEVLARAMKTQQEKLGG